MIKSVRHFGIVVSDIDKALHFYRDLLGLEIQKDMIEEGEFIDAVLGLEGVKVRTIKMSAEGGSLVELLYYFSLSHVREPKVKEMPEIGASHLAFTVENIDELYEKLKAGGVKFNCSPSVSVDGKAKVTYCFDPDGTPVELVQVLKDA